MASVAQTCESSKATRSEAFVSQPQTTILEPFSAKSEEDLKPRLISLFQDVDNERRQQSIQRAINILRDELQSISVTSMYA